MHTISVKRVYEPRAPADGFRVLVDRVWPRGITKKDAAIDLWARDVAPSTELRKWFGHDPARWDEFQHRYKAELHDQTDALKAVLDAGGNKPITLVFSAHDEEHNQAIVLRDVLSRMAKSRG